MADKTWGKTVLGWFVVTGDDASSAGAGSAHSSDAGPQALSDLSESLIAKYGDIPVASVPSTGATGSAAFAQVYEAAGIDADERGRVDRAMELLRTLPADTPAATKKQIVEASLKAFNVPTDKIIEAAVSQIEALQAFIVTGQRDTQQQLDEGNQRIAKLEAELVAVKQGMQQAVADQQGRQGSANNEKLRVQQVLEFFGQDAVARVVQDSPRLGPPSGGGK